MLAKATRDFHYTWKTHSFEALSIAYRTATNATSLVMRAHKRANV